MRSSHASCIIRFITLPPDTEDQASQSPPPPHGEPARTGRTGARDQERREPCAPRNRFLPTSLPDIKVASRFVDRASTPRGRHTRPGVTLRRSDERELG